MDFSCNTLCISNSPVRYALLHQIYFVDEAAKVQRVSWVILPHWRRDLSRKYSCVVGGGEHESGQTEQIYIY